MKKLQNPGRNQYFKLMLLIPLLFLFLNSNGITKYARGGNWNSTSTWSSTYNGATGVAVPTASDAVVFVGGVTVTVTESASCASIGYYSTYASASTLIINDGVTLTTGAITYKIPSLTGTTLINVGNGTLACSSILLIATNTTGKYCELLVNNGTVTITGNLTSGGINSKLTCSGTGTVNVGGSFLSTAATFTCGTGTINFTGAAQNVGGANANYTFYNLTLSGSGEKTFSSIYGSGINTEINGTLTLEGTATCKLITDMFSYGAAATLKYRRIGVTSPAVGVEWVTPFAATGGIIISGNSEIKLASAKALNTGISLTIENGATLNTQDNKITLGGNLIKNGYIIAGASTFSLEGTSNQYISDISTGGNLEMNKTGGTATLGGPITVGKFIINGVGGTIDLGSYSHTIYQDWELTEGTVLGNSGTLSVYGNFIKTNGVFDPGTSTINWKNPIADISVIDYYNVALGNISSSTSSYSTTKNITIPGNINLLTFNPTSTNALLDLGSYTLLLEPTATVTGFGDIAGIVERQTFTPNTPYSFSNLYTSLTLSAEGTIPSSIKVKTTIGAAPTNKTDAVLRKYEIIQTGGANNNINIKLHYLNDELNSNNEKALVLWKYDIVSGVNQNFTEIGKSNYDYDNEFVEVTNVPISSIATSFDNKGYTLAVSASPTYIWVGIDANNNTDWNEANNWDPVGVPGTTSNVIIPDGAPVYPVVDAINVKSISIESNDAIFDGSTYDITINGGLGAWSDPAGHFICGSKRVNFTNAEATINGLSTFYDLNVADGAKLTIDNNAHITITNSLTTAGTGSIDAIKSPNTIEYLNSGTAISLPTSLTNYHHLVLNGIHTMPSVSLLINGNLLFTGDAANTANGNITTKGDLTINTASEFNSGNHNLTFGGDFINDGTFTNTSSDIYLSFEDDEQYIDAFSTTGAVTMNKTAGIVYFDGNTTTGDLVIDGASSGLDLGLNTIDINGTVEFTNGNLLGSGSTINVNGISTNAWAGDGSLFDFGSSIVNFNGLGIQKITATDAQFYQLNFGGTGLKTIAAPIIVSENLYIGGENVTTDSKDILVYGTMTIDINAEFTSGISTTAVNHTVMSDFTNYGTYNALDASILTLEANFINEGDFICLPNSTLKMSSTYTDQQLSSTTNLDLVNLTQNNVAGKLHIMSPINVDGVLSLTTGNIVSTETEYINMTDGSEVSPVSGSLKSFVEGPMAKDGTTAFIFPIGTADHWAPIGIGAPTSQTTFYAMYHDAAHVDCETFSEPLTKVSSVEYWDLDRIVGTGNATVNLFWKDATFSKISSAADLRIAHYNGTNWENTTDNINFIEDGTHVYGNIFTTVNMSSFSPYTFGTLDNLSNPLPVEIISLSAFCEENSVKITWLTASEINNDFFTLESSKDNSNWREVEIIDGAGNSNALTNYSCTDFNPDNAIFYRLKHTDFDGSSYYSDAIYVDCMNNEDFERNLNIYPNPTNNSFNIEGSPIGTEYFIYSSYGNLIGYGLIENQSTSIDFSDKSAGLYNIIFKFNNQIFEKMVIKE